MIQFDNVNKRYESGQDALGRVSLEIERAEMVFLTGHSGAGTRTAPAVRGHGPAGH